MSDSSFAFKVRQLSQHRKISQEELASILGISQSRISQILRAQDIKLSQAFALAKRFDVSLDYLADPEIPVHSEPDLAIKKQIRDLVARLGPERAFNRLILMERAETSPTTRHSVPEDNEYPNDLGAIPEKKSQKNRRK